MFFKLIADTLSVSRDPDHFVQLKTLKKPKTDDQIWVAIEIVGESKYARATAQSIVDTLEEVYFDHPELNAYERFEQSLKEVNLIMNSLKEKREAPLGKINAIIATLSGQELHLTQAGDGEAYLIRNGKFSMISEGLGSKSEDLFVNIASGELTQDDKLIFSSGRLLRLATHSQIVQLFGDGVAEAVEAIRDLTMNDEELSIGIVCIHTKLSQQGMAEPETRGENSIAAKIKGLLSSVSGIFAGKRMPMQTPGGIGGRTDKKKILIVLAAVSIMLVLSISFLMHNRRTKAIREEYRLKIEELHQELHAANTKGYANDKEGANLILEKVDKEARQILESNYFRAEAMALVDKIQETRDSINNTDRKEGLAPYADLSEKKADVQAIGLTSMDDNLYVFEFSRIYEIILDQVLDPRTIDENEVVVAGVAMEDQDVLVFLTQSGRVVEYDKGQVRFANTEDQIWESGVDVDTFGKYLYLLSPQDNQIYKYARLRNTYSRASGYNTDADLQNAISMAIDGNIYVLKKGGQIIRIYKSKQQPFRIEDMPSDLDGATQVFTSPELDNLYVLDPPNKRVLMVAKSKGEISRYYGQIVFEDLDNIKSMYVEKNESKLYILTDKEIYRLDI